MKTAALTTSLAILLPTLCPAQVGRGFVSVEAFVGQGRIVHVGKIVELEEIEYEGELTSIQELGEPHRLVFEIGETIRGEKVERLELVLALQSPHYLEYMRDKSIEIMLVGSPHRLTRFPSARIGIEEAGRRVDGEWYHFRVLDPLEIPKGRKAAAFAEQINIYYDSARMFTTELELVAGREAILARARDFAKRHRELLPGVTLMVPNEFGALCGDPAAFCGITFPVCPATKKMLLSLKKDPGIILRRIESRDPEWNLKRLKEDVPKALEAFKRPRDE